MRFTLIRSIAVLTIVAAAAGCATQTPAPPPVDTAAIQTEIANIDRAFATAVSTGDTAAIWNYYADDAKILPPNAPLAAGTDQLRATWREFLAMPGLNLQATSGGVIVSQAGDMAVETGSYVMKFNDAKGNPVEDVGKYVTVFRKTDAGWKAIIDMFNSDQPIPGM